MTLPPRNSANRADMERDVDSSFFRWSRLLLVGLLFCAPLAFGSVEPWAWGTMAVVIAITLLFWTAGSLRNRRLVVAWSWLYVPGIVLFGFVLVQLDAHLSVDPASTSEAVLKLALCLLIFFLTMQLYYIAPDRKSTRLNSSHRCISYAVF